MDDRGYWHNRNGDQIREMMNAQADPERTNALPRYVISFDIGSTVEVKAKDGVMLAVFEAAEKNKVTLRPIDEAGKPRPYLELAEHVRLSDGTNDGVAAQVWDNRNGKIILRTLPVGA